MSVQAMTWVFDLEGDHAPKLGTRLVLLALADNAGPRGDDERMVAWPSVATLARKACLSERATQYALRSLRDEGLISEVGKSAAGTVVYALSMGVQNLHRGGAEFAPGGVKQAAPEPSLEPSVEEVSNETSSSEVEKSMSERDALPMPGAHRLCERLAELIRTRDPKAKVAPNSIRWLEAADRLMRIDERHFEEAMEVLEWSQADSFEQTVVLSMTKFRERYTALRAKWQASRQPRAAAAPQASVADLVSAYDRPRSRTGVR